MDNQKQNPIADQQSIDPFRILDLVLRFKNVFTQMWIMMVILGLLLGGFFWYRAKRSFVPQYQAKAIFTVDAGYNPEDIFGAAAYYDQYAAQQMAKSFRQLIGTDMMRDLVVQELEKGSITCSANAVAVADSNMVVLTATGTNAYDVYDYLNAVIKCYPQVAAVMVENPQLKIITSPVIPEEHFNSFQGQKALIKGVMAGVGISLAIMLMCAIFTKTVQTTDELKKAINLPILVALPKVDVKKRRTGDQKLITADSDPNMTECMRGLRMKLKKMLHDKEQKIILITSTLAGEGKTTIAINTASALARDGHKVLLIDADLHSQSVARVLGEPVDRNGLLECMTNSDLSAFSCIRTSESQKIDYISGRSTDKRHYTLNINKINSILSELRREYDYIVLDTPPNDVVSDAMALCRCASCVLYVVRQDHVQRNQVINSIASMHDKGIVISGCIFNGVPKYQRNYGYGYRYGYGYGYDYGSRKYHYGDKYSYTNKYRYNSYSSYAQTIRKRKK